MSGYVVDPDLLATMRAVLSERAPLPREQGKGVALDLELWNHLDSLGLTRLTGAESAGGSGATWHEAAALLSELAASGLALPVGEHDLLAGWLLETAGLPADQRRRTVAVLDADGVADGVPWARDAELVVCLYRADGDLRVADVELGRLSVEPGQNLAGEPRDRVSAAGSSLDGVAVDASVAGELQLRAALVRAVQVAGALERCVELAIAHTTTRVQFGRPISRFQLVQELIADAASEAALARAAVQTAVAAIADGATLEFPVAVARSCVGHACSVVVRHAHQLHGALGTTLEHQLHRFTLAAWAWRSEYGSTEEWDRRVAAVASAAGADGLWELIVG